MTISSFWTRGPSTALRMICHASLLNANWRHKVSVPA